MAILASVIYHIQNTEDDIDSRFLRFRFGEPIKFFGYDFRNTPSLITATFNRTIEHRTGFDDYENISYSMKFESALASLSSEDCVYRFANQIKLKYITCSRLPKDQFLKIFPGFFIEDSDKIGIDPYIAYDEGNPPEMIFVGYLNVIFNEVYVLDHYGIPHEITIRITDPSNFNRDTIHHLGSFYATKDDIMELFKEGKDFGDAYSYVIDDVLPDLIKNPVKGFENPNYVPVIYLCEPSDMRNEDNKECLSVYVVTKSK